MSKPTKEEISFVWDKIDDDGNLIEPLKEEQDNIEPKNENNQQQNILVDDNNNINDTNNSQNEKNDEKENDNNEKDNTDNFFSVKYAGADIIFDKDEVPEALEKGIQALEKIKEYQQFDDFINIITEGNITLEDLVALKDLKSGNKKAISYFNQWGGSSTKNDDFLTDDDFIDYNEIQKENANEYKPQIQKEEKHPVEAYFEELAKTNSNLANNVLETYNNLPNTVKAELGDINVFKGFVSSLQSGEWNKIYPVAIKLHLKGMSFVNAYVTAGQQLLQQEQNNNRNNEKLENAIIRDIKDADSTIGGSEDDFEHFWSMSIEELEKQVIGDKKY